MVEVNERYRVQTVLLLMMIIVQIIKMRRLRRKRAANKRKRDEAYRVGKKQTRFDYVRAYKAIHSDYLSEHATFSELDFKHEFGIKKHRFYSILEDLEVHNAYFQRRKDCTGRLGCFPEQKILAALGSLCQGTSPKRGRHYYQFGKTTGGDALYNFCHSMIEIYGKEYLNKELSAEYVEHLMEKHSKQHGFPGMIGSIDCWHWGWNGCPVAHKGQYTGKEGKPTLVLEAAADYDLFVFHSFFGLPGSNNDKTIFQASPFLRKYKSGDVARVPFTIEGEDFDLPYVLADGIYYNWPMTLKTLEVPTNEAEKKYAKKQESARKDIERVFGVIIKTFKILKTPTEIRDLDFITNILHACIILHNMNMLDRIEDGETVEEYEANLPAEPEEVEQKVEEKAEEEDDTNEEEDDTNEEDEETLSAMERNMVTSKQEYMRLRSSIVKLFGRSCVSEGENDS